MPPRRREVPVEANPELEDENVETNEEAAKPKYRTLKYLGKEPNWKCYATSPPLEFVDRVCRVVPESVAAVLIKNKKKKLGLPLFMDLTPGVEKLVNPETEGLPEQDDEDIWNEDN